jgi:hypothetical protein
MDETSLAVRDGNDFACVGPDTPCAFDFHIFSAPHPPGRQKSVSIVSTFAERA